MADIFDSTIKTLISSMDLRATRHRYLASNIANIDTPGYKAVDIKFADELRRAGSNGAAPRLVGTNPGHIGTGSRAWTPSPEVITTGTAGQALDGNSVGVEREMVKLSENTMMYTVSTKLLRYKFGILMNAIKEGGR